MVYGLTSVDDKPGLNGGYSEYLVMRSNSGVYKMDPSISVEDAVFFNPLGSGLDWGVRLAGTQIGDTVLIAGPGQRGLGCVIGAGVEAGAANIIVAGRGLRPWKLDLARRAGCHPHHQHRRGRHGRRREAHHRGAMADRA